MGRRKIKNIRKFRKARIWSNACLRKYADYFSGDICNVSAANDEDKEGNKYRDYFHNAKKYYITNWGGYRGFNGSEGEIFLNLEEDLPSELVERFDVIFNHTTLEHIYHMDKAFENMCLMAKDVCIVVVPFLQEVHISESYDDYWRFTPYAMQKMFAQNGYSLVVCEHNNEFDTAVYLFCIGIRDSKLIKYSENFTPIILSNEKPVGRWLGNDNCFFQRLKSRKTLS